LILKYGSVAMLFVAGMAALFPRELSWAYIGAFAVFEYWLLWRMRSMPKDPVPVGEDPYRFDPEEAQLAGRYRFYFTYPAIARDAASILAAIGLSSLVVSPWLLIRQQFVPAILVALNLLAVGALTKRLSPVMVLKIAASKGDRDSLRLLEAHETAWAKIKAENSKAE
jgi:hypothetical protein